MFAASLILDALVDHAAASGHFERVNSLEPARRPGHGLTCAVWVDEVAPVPTTSGLAATSARITALVRLYTGMTGARDDAIDPNLLAALDALFTAYHNDLDVGGTAMTIDVLGMSGRALTARAGYLELDGGLMRVYTIDVPVIVADAWEQT